jgi:Ca2+:H+ antiporter
MDKVFVGMLIFTPLAIGAHYLGAPPVATFFLAAIAVIPLAKFIGEGTEQLAARTSPAVGGLLNSTFGNATELIIAIFALQAGLIEVVKASITGSIIGNLLLVVGLSMIAGGYKFTKQSFNRTAILASGSSLFVMVIALVLPAIFLETSPGIGEGVIQNLSVGVSIVLLALYAASLFFTLRTHKHLYTQEVGEMPPRWSAKTSLIVLSVSTIAVAVVSEILVGSIEPLVDTLGWTQLFVGVIFLAIIGNAAEHFSAVTVALKDRMDLSLQIAIGSAAQIAMLVAPLLVLLSLVLGHPMNLVFNLFELVAIVLSVMAINLVVVDGESNWLEGLQLIAAYVIAGIAFFFHP